MTPDASLQTFDKVTVFVLRRRGDSTDILTFLHPLAGRQIPAGSVERGEPLADAARREVIEETGFDRLTEFVGIGEWIETLEGSAVALADTVLSNEDGIETDRVRRGHRVRVERFDGTRVLVRLLIYDFNADPPVESPTAAGWTEATNFGTRIRRTFFWGISVRQKTPVFALTDPGSGPVRAPPDGWPGPAAGIRRSLFALCSFFGKCRHGPGKGAPLPLRAG